jgi:hypothetical protein
MPGFDWDLGTAVSSEYDADGFLYVAFDSYGEKNSGVPPAELHSAYGFLSRSLDPDVDPEGNPTLGCNLWRAFEGNVPHSLFAQDPRVMLKLPQLKKGEAMFHGAASNFIRCKEDGSVVTMATSDGTSTGQTIFHRIGPTDDMIFAPWGKRTFDANGYHLFTRSGARLDMGGIGGLPSPLSSLGSYATLSAKILRLDGTIVAIGPSGAPADAVAKATPVLTALAALNSVLAALVTPGAYVSAAPGSPAVPGPGLIAAVAAAEATLAAAPGLVPSNSATVT